MAALVATLFFHTALSGPAVAQDVTLSSIDGRLTVSGNLIAYDGEYLRLETEFGLLTLDARGLLCEGPGCPLLTQAVVEVRIEGAQVIAERLFPPVLEAFATAQNLELTSERHGDQTLYHLRDPVHEGPVMRLRVRASSGDDGLMALVSGETDLALSLTPLQDDDFLLHVLALDAFVPVVAPDGAIERITMADLRELLNNGRMNREEPNEPDTHVALHLRNLDAGEYHALGARLLAIGAENLSDAAMRHASNDALATAVARDPFALGMMLLSEAQGLRIAPLIDDCALPMTPDTFSLKAGEYPLTQPLYAIQLRQRLPLRLRQLLDFFTSPGAVATIRAAGFTDPRPEPVLATSQGQRLINTLLLPSSGDDAALVEGLREAATLMLEGEQLSVAFRFEPGTSRIDATSLVQMRQLAREIEAGVHDGHEIILVGFTDSLGTPEANRRLARRRSEAVRRALAEAAPLRNSVSVVLGMAGFGLLLPIACNESEWGRALNRRVEVWRRPLRG